MHTIFAWNTVLATSSNTCQVDHLDQRCLCQKGGQPLCCNRLPSSFPL